MTSNKKENSLGLTIPEVKSSGKQKKINHAWVQKWKATLPLADTGECAKKIYTLLCETNHMQLSAKEHFMILEEIRAPLYTVATAMQKHFVEQASPLSEKKMLIANLRLTIENEMANNYKLIIDKLHDKTKNNEELSILITSINRAIYYLSKILIYSYEVYCEPMPGVWKEIHLLYKFSKKENYLDIEVDCPFTFQKKCTTIKHSYIKILIFATIDPYHWRQKEQKDINKALDLWSMFPEILDSNNMPKKGTGIYIINLDDDAPPIPMVFFKGEKTNSCIGLNLNKNITRVEEIINEMHQNELRTKISHQGDPEFSITMSSLKKLVKLWGQKMTRKETRYPMDAEVKVVFGLPAAHYYINNEKEFNPKPANIYKEKSEKEEDNEVSDLPVFEVSDDDGDHEENNETHLDIKAPQLMDSSDPSHEVEANHSLYSYHLTNFSNTGLCISVLDKSCPPFKCGEIALFKNVTKEDRNWSIAAVRWIKRNSDGIFQIGMQLISPIARAGGIQFIRDNKPYNYLVRCLILPEMPDQEINTQIITSTLPLHSNKILLYVDNQDGVSAELEKEIDATGMYYQYTYTAKQSIEIERKQEVTKKKEVKQPKSKFDNLWDQL